MSEYSNTTFNLCAINVEQAYVWSTGALQFHTNKRREQFGDKHL